MQDNQHLRPCIQIEESLLELWWSATKNKKTHGAERSGARRAAPESGRIHQMVRLIRASSFSSSSRPPTSSSSCNHSHKRLSRQRKARGFVTGGKAKARTKEGATLDRCSPLVPGRAHTGRPRTCPCGVSARDIAEEEEEPTPHDGACKRPVKISAQVGKYLLDPWDSGKYTGQ